VAQHRHDLSSLGSNRNSTADLANNAFPSSFSRLLLQKFTKNVQMVAEQQMVWRVHKKLQRRQRTDIENKNNCSLSFVDNNWSFNGFLSWQTLTATVSFATADRHGLCCGSSKHLPLEVTDLQERHIGNTSKIGKNRRQ